MSKPKLPSDPRDYYVHTECSLAELAETYKGKKGCSLDNLKRRSRTEGWQKQYTNIATETTLKVDEKLIEAKSSLIADRFSRVGRIFDTIMEQIENDLPMMGLTVQDGEGFANKLHLETWKTAIKAYFDAEKEKGRLAALKPPEDPNQKPTETAGYIDMWKWTEEQKLIYLATGQVPEESNVDT